MSWVAEYFVVLVALGIGFVLAVVVTRQNRSPQSTLAWLLAFVLLPYVSIPLFLALGFRKNPDGLQRIGFRDGPRDQGLPAQTDLICNASPASDVFSAYGLPAAARGHDFALCSTPEAAHASLFEVINGARSDLCAQFYIISNDPTGRAFVQALTDQARSGLRVRLILDWLGSFVAPKSALRAFVAAGGELTYAARPGLRTDGLRLNLRNHRKAVIADGTAVFTGGMNVGDHYLAEAPKDGSWVDLNIRLSGPVVQDFQAVFEADWRAAGGLQEPQLSAGAASSHAEGQVMADDNLVPEAQCCIQVVPSGPDVADDPLHDGLVHAIHCARNRVLVATPYFLPSDALGEALRNACKRGLDVSVMVPARSNQTLADFARGPYLRDIEAVGGNVLLHPRMLHAKMGVIDQTAWAGSANFDMRSMLLNYELVSFISDRTTVGTLAQWFASQSDACHAMPETTSHVQHVLERTFRLMAPLL